MFRRKVMSVFLLSSFLLPTLAFSQTTASIGEKAAAAPAPTKIYSAPKATIDRIRDEGMNHSQVMNTLSYLTDVIGGRLTNSPNMKREWGMANAKLESWGPFGRGWSLKSFSAQVNEPTTFPVIAYPKAWSPSTKGAVTSDVVFLDVKSDEDFAKYKGQLRGKIVLISKTRELKPDFTGMGERYNDEALAKLAAAVPEANEGRSPRPANGAPAQMTPQQQERMQRFMMQLKAANFLLEEGAAVIVDNSGNGSGGTLFVQGANVAQEVPATPQQVFGNRNRLQPYQKESEAKMLPQMTMATEDYNRIVRMIQNGAKPKMTVDIQTQYHDEDLMGYNTVAEIPGTDPVLKDEIVMLGGHLDSWHSGTGATDNAAGCAVAMEAARILMTSGLKPRRTIRVALWSGEEQGLNGSREYVTQQFGERKRGENGQPGELVKTANYDKLSAYYNLDNGTGKIRGVYMQGNAGVRPYFETWLAPFADLGATTLTISDTGGTDHQSFDRIGLPGFQFIQDEIEYDTRTHHSNQDNYDRIQAEDMKQAATIMAAFVYQTAMMDEKMPRKVVK